MTYCTICEKVTNDTKKKSIYNTKYDRVTVECDECRTFKYSYLETTNKTRESELWKRQKSVLNVKLKNLY